MQFFENMKYLYALFIGFVLFSCSPIEPEQDLFEYFWKTMDKNYVYFDEKGVNWDSVHSVYYPRTRNLTEKELVPVFQEIINLFKDNHLWIETKDTAIYYPLQIATVVDSLAYGGFPYEYYSQPTHIDGDNESYIVIYQLNNNIVYVIVLSFSNMEFDYRKFNSLMQQFSYSKGIILDLRANDGGSGSEMTDLAACFFVGNRTIYYSKAKIGAGHNDFSDPTPITATGFGYISDKIPVVVLCGSTTYSAGNFFVGIMKYLPNITVIGTKTGGGGSGRWVKIMPNGWKLYYPATPSYDIKMNSLEPGVEPDITINATREELLENPCLVNETAYNYLLNK